MGIFVGRVVLGMVGLAIVAGCAPQVPNSAPPQGAGFQQYGDFNAYRADRDAVLTGDAADGGNAAIQTALAEATGTDANNPNISDEQNFDAVANRQSIESDAARLQAQRDSFQVIEPTALPQDDGSSGPNIVEYALSSNNPVGNRVHRRFGPGQRKFERNCAAYPSADQAQEAFLAAGGPDRDRLGLDPDGDGYACAWSPAAIRQVAGRG